MSVLEIRNLSRGYGGTPVLANVDFSVAAGEVVGLLGRNGAGKTTLIRIAMGMLEADAGRVKLFGLDPREEPLEVKQRVGYVSEDQVLPPFLKVKEVIGLHRKLFNGWNDEMAHGLAERFRLPLGKKISQMSKGQARQVAFQSQRARPSCRPEIGAG